MSATVSRLRHRGDPTTSLHAARLMETSGALARQEREVLEMVRCNPGLTFEELAEVEGSLLDRYAVARRMKALMEAGLVEAGAERALRSGRMGRTYWPVTMEQGTGSREQGAPL